jgi:type I restriction-modification system DNA methylase subunit
MNNNENEDYEEIIDSVVESIKNRKNKRNKNTEDDGEYNYYRLLDFFEETEKRADDYLKRINIKEISKKFVLIKETDNNILIDRLLNEKYISNSDRKEVEEYIHKIKKESLNQLVNLSFIKNDKVFLTVLAFR